MPTEFFTSSSPASNFAVMLDAVKCATGLLKLQSASFRRIILLLSQSQDDGSTAHGEDVVRSLAESGTTFYSLAFPTEKTPLKSHSTRHVRRSPISVLSDNSILVTHLIVQYRWGS